MMEYLTRKLVMHGQLNAGGSLFGGQCLSWIDEESAIVAISVLKTHSVVTKCISKIDFKAPAKLGDIVEIGTRVIRIGNTSITISCTIRNMTTEQEIVTVDEIVFVSLGEDGRPKPHGIKQMETFTCQLPVKNPVGTDLTELPKGMSLEELKSTPTHKEGYAEIRRRIEEINKLFKEVCAYARENDLYLNIYDSPWNLDDNPCGLETAEPGQEDWEASSIECGYRNDPVDY